MSRSAIPRALWSLLLVAGLVSAAGCLFAPNIAAEGYTSCEATSACPAGRRCELGYCVPPPWWNDQYTARYQVVVDNSSAESLPAGVLGELVIGESGDLSLEQAGYGPALILDTGKGDEQTRAVAMRDPRDTAYAFVFQLPELPARSEHGQLWLYVGGSSDLAPVYSDPAEVFAFYEPFTMTSLPSESYRSDGTLDFNGSEVLLRPGAWLVSTASFVESRVSFDAQLVGSDCSSFGIGLAAGNQPQSLAPPYAMFAAGADGEVLHEIYASSLSSLQVVGDGFFADGFPHRYEISVVGDQVRFTVDQIVTAEATAELPIDDELHLHLYSNDCTMRVETVQASPAVVTPPGIELSERIIWSP